MGTSSAPSCSSTYIPSSKVRPLAPKYTAQTSRASVPPHRTNAKGHDLTHTQYVQKTWDRTRSCSASMVSTARARAAATSTAEPGIGTGAGIGTTIAERRHLSRIRSESQNTERAYNHQQQEQQQEQQQYYRQQVQLQPPSLFDAESLSRFEVPLQRETNNTDRSQNSGEEFSPKTPVPENVAVESDQDVERESDTLPRQEQANGSHGHRQARGGMVSVETDLATEAASQGSSQVSESAPAVITPNPATLRKCQSTHVCMSHHFKLLESGNRY